MPAPRNSAPEDQVVQGPGQLRIHGSILLCDNRAVLDLLGRRRPAVIVWGLIAAAAAALRLIRLNHFSYWLDEILETFVIRYDWAGLWRTLSVSWSGLNAPLDFVALKLLESLHPSDAIRRLPAVAWGVGCVVMLGFLVVRRAGRFAGWSAAGLLALAPYHVRYSQEVRHYSLGLFLLAASLFLLEASLESPAPYRILLLFAACTATIYTLYVAGLLLAMVAAAMVLEDAFDADARRRATARRFLLWSPVFAVAVAIAYGPWWPAFVRALRSAPLSSPPGFRAERAARLISYFGFAASDWTPLGIAGTFFLTLALIGAIHACRTHRLRFLLVWAVGGLAVIEILEQRKPTYDSIFHWLPAGLGLTAVAGVAVGKLIASRHFRALGIAVVALAIAFDARSLATYFREGRPDWRPLAAFLRGTPAAETIFTANQYTQICLAYYVVGPDWLCCRREGQRAIVSVDGDAARLEPVWDRRRDAWLAVPGGPAFGRLLVWSAAYPSTRFPTAEGEGGVLLRRLTAER